MFKVLIFLLPIMTLAKLNLSFNSSTEISPMEDCLLNLISNYFKNSSYGLIINHTGDSTFLKAVNLPIVIGTSFQNFNFQISSVIVFIENKSMENIWEFTSRTSDTKFIVVTNEENVSIVTQCFWKLRILFVLILVAKRNLIDVYTYYPFRVQNCSEFSKPILINTWNKSKKQFNDLWIDLKESDEIDVDLMRCSLNVSFMDFPPFVIRDKEKVEVVGMAGIEGNMMEIVATKLNFTPRYINRHEHEWGNFKPEPTGLVGDLYTYSSDFGFGGLYLFPTRYEYLDTAVAYNFLDSSVFVTPEGAGALLPEWMTLFIMEFKPMLWICVFSAFLISIFFFWQLYSFTGESEQKTNVITIFALLLGQSQKGSEIWSVRSYTVCWIWFGFIITSAYQSFLSGRLTAPPHTPNINSVKQLVDSHLTLNAPIGRTKIVKQERSRRNKQTS